MRSSDKNNFGGSRPTSLTRLSCPVTHVTTVTVPSYLMWASVLRSIPAREEKPDSLYGMSIRATSFQALWMRRHHKDRADKCIKYPVVRCAEARTELTINKTRGNGQVPGLIRSPCTMPLMATIFINSSLLFSGHLAFYVNVGISRRLTSFSEKHAHVPWCVAFVDCELYSPILFY